MSELLLAPGIRVVHAEFGEGVVTDDPRTGYVRAFFPSGERRVPVAALRRAVSREEAILAGIEGTDERLRRAWLAWEAHALPLMESAAALTAARIDLLPHQVVLTHRIATASPRRFLIADEVGLGKTIETALILRELASRGELKRALMVVPAGLVNNWHRELNEVFHLDFEVFGSEGDVTDRKTNAFAKHDRLIASVDTLKRPNRIQKLKAAPIWDLVVFDEAHHLTAFRTGQKVTRTENYKLAEALRGHTRDLLLLSATPHQGDHFRFWMLVQLLSATLFKSADEMVANRHRLNEVVFRRTKADACKPNGDTLFARRLVHTESFIMNAAEKAFYEELRKYLEDGFALAKRQGGKGRALGFVMTIFQKIAASSFAAVRRTLRRRLLALTLHEGILRDEEMDIAGREELFDEARAIIRQEYGIGDDAIGRGQVDRILAELKVKLLRKLSDEEMEAVSAGAGGEIAEAGGEDAVATLTLVLPEERLRIRTLLAQFPEQRETKVQKLLDALGWLWRQNPSEKVVIFATYLGTVELLGRAINEAYPGQGVVVLQGGDHGSKLAAEKRFKAKDGPRVLVCTAAGREGINLQFSRILFNFDLPWNPMDVEQRIGRIHRYGQNHTAQVYNLVLSDTIEGHIFLLLDEKLTEIGKALGKVDEAGNVAEDLRSQILGQLAEKLNYDKLYQQALSDPELKRTRLELNEAMSNAKEARKVVFELFQDLDGFSLDDYKPYANVGQSVDRLVRFFAAASAQRGFRVERLDDVAWVVLDGTDQPVVRFTTDRDVARERDDLDLLGLDHPRVQEELRVWRGLRPEELGGAVTGSPASLLAWWLVQTHGRNGEQRSLLVPLAADAAGRRLPPVERLGSDWFHRPVSEPAMSAEERTRLYRDHLEPMLERELHHRGAVPDEGGFTARLVAVVELAGER
jgi:hypothetical protein